MSDLLSSLYPWIKSLHIVSVISWMAGLFYLPRLFVHHVEQAEQVEGLPPVFEMMEFKLLKVIMNPASIATWVFGLMLVFTPGIVDWSFTRWGPPEADLVEMAICEAEPRPNVGRAFYEAYLEAGGLPPREPLFRRALVRELERRLQYHAQSHDPLARNAWTHWLTNLRRPDAVSTRVFDAGRLPGRSMA